MSDAGLVDRMQLIASGLLGGWSSGFSPEFGGTAQASLYFDASETQQFYVYTLATKTAHVQTAQQAKAFFQGSPKTLPGTTSWGYVTDNNTAVNNTPLLNPKLPSH